MYQFNYYSPQIQFLIWVPFFQQRNQIPYQQFIPNFNNEQSLASVQNSQSQKMSGENFTLEDKLNAIIPRLQSLHEGISANKKTHWSQTEDQLLQKLVEREKVEWKQIPKFFDGRTLSMCYSRYRRILMNTKQGWKKQDEEFIISMVNSIGEKWKQISLQIPKFTPKQIRQRYLNYLRPDIDKSEFTYSEDLIICQLVIKQGKHWRKFEEELPGRTQGAIKSRFYSKLKNLIKNS